MGFFSKKKVEGYEVYEDENKENKKNYLKESLNKENKKNYLKESLKSIGSGIKKVGNFIVTPKSPEQIAYEKELKEKTNEAYRKSYLKEAVKEATKKAKLNAQQKYNKPSIDSINYIANVGVPKKTKKSNDFNDFLMRS